MPRLYALALSLVVLVPVAAQDGKKKYVKDLSDMDFTRRDLTGKDYADHNLENCVFTFATLKEGKFRGANLRGADFSSASLDKSDMSETDLREAKFTWAGAQGVNFDKANLTGVDMSNTSVQGSTFKEADLRKVKGIKDITRADFSGADLRGANLQDSKDYSNNAIFKGAKYDRSTRWPRGFDLEKSGAVLVKEEPKQ